MSLRRWIEDHRVVEAMKSHPCATITAERLDVPSTIPGTTPILVRCDWHDVFPERHMVPKKLAVL
ncbi:hypothetical protein V6L77_26125 [Pannonibacter sp. Pt2-lr]